MDRDAILKRFDEPGVWRQGDRRAPHKPLLVLYALGRWRRGLADVGFREAEPELTALLREFGPPRRSDHPEKPFWRLQRDGVWTVHAPAGLALKTGDTIPRATELRSHDVRKASATLLKSHKDYGSLDGPDLGHAPKTLADRHYSASPQALFDEAIHWLGQQYGA